MTTQMSGSERETGTGHEDKSEILFTPEHIKAVKGLGGPDFATARTAQLADVLILRHTSAALEFDAGAILP